MARSMLSLGMLEARAVVTAVRRRGLAFTSPPPIRAATVISLIILVKIFPRLASLAAFLCLIELHFEWPDMRSFRPRACAAPLATGLDGLLVCYHSGTSQVNAERGQVLSYVARKCPKLKARVS